MPDVVVLDDDLTDIQNTGEGMSRDVSDLIPVQNQATNGVQAIKCPHANRFDIIGSDMNLHYSSQENPN